MGKSAAADVYRKALLRLKGKTVTPATLHEKVSDIVGEQFQRLYPFIPLPNLPDPFILGAWQAWLVMYRPCR